MDSRVIKFRGWDTEEKQMYSWEDIIELYEQELFDFDQFFRFDHWVPMQFTGLIDKNGKEIWEGDIVQEAISGTKLWKQEVFWNQGTCSFDVKPCTPYSSINLTYSKYRKVIGNIYENPEMIE